LEEQLNTLNAIASFNPGFWAGNVLEEEIEVTGSEEGCGVLSNIPQARVRAEGKVYLI
jgi:hypothetical protein